MKRIRKKIRKKISRFIIVLDGGSNLRNGRNRG